MPVTVAQPAHPMLMGLRFLAFGDCAAPRNAAEAGGPSAPSSVTAVTNSARLGTRFGALTGNGTTSDVTYGNASDYSLAGRSITVLCRCRARVGQISGVVAARDGSTSGWQILFSDFGGAEDGYQFAVFGAGVFVEGQDGFGAAAQAGKDVFVAGVYDHLAHEARLWTRQPGEPVAALRGVNTNTNSGDVPGTDWDVRVAQPVHLFNLAGASNFFDGDVGWVAVFDRALSGAEIELWSMDEEWPFEDDGINATAYPVSPPPPPPPPPVPPPPGPPPLPGAGPGKPLIDVVPDAPPRMRRHTQKVAEILNSLMTAGKLVQTGPKSWSVAPADFILARAPTVDDDDTTGVLPGARWVDTNAGAIYFNIDASTGAAVWTGPF
jgi:hypothetical protein